MIAFTATTRLSGLDHDGRSWRKGAVDSVLATVRAERARRLHRAVDGSRGGRHAARGRPDGRLMGVIELKDIVKPGIRDRFDALRRMGIRTSWSPATTA